MPVVLRFPRGSMKPPPGSLLSYEHPFMRGHLMSVLFNDAHLTSVGSFTWGPQVFVGGGVRPRNAIPTLAALSTASNLEGRCLRFTPGARLDLGSATGFTTDRITVLMIRRKTDSTNRDCLHFSTSAGDNMRAFCPYTDGIVYWDFGGSSGPNRLQVSGLSFSTFIPERFIFTAGKSGSAIWQNGIKVASQSTAIICPGTANNVVLNDAPGDNFDVNFFMVIGEQWSDEMCRWWSAEPYAHLYSPQAKCRYFFLGGTAGASDGFTIDGTPHDILQSWQITEQLNERGTMRFGVKSMDASYRPGLREVIDFRNFSIHFFAGHIHHTDEGGLGGYGVVPIVTQCGATDFNALPDRRQVAITLAAGTLKSQLIEAAELLEIYGVTLDPAQVDGPSLVELVFTIGTLKALLDKLSVASGYGWNISYDLVLSMFAPGTLAAPFDIVDNDARVKGDVRVSPTTVEYGNKIYVNYTVPAETAFVYFFINNIPTDGSTFKAAGQTFTFRATPVDPNDVQIEGSVAAQRATVAGVIDALDEVTGFDQGTRVDVYAAEEGVGGNSIQVESNDGNGNADFFWGVDGVAIASHLYYGKDAALTGQVTAEDVPAQNGGLNLYEKTYNEPTAESQETAQALADGYLVRSLVQPREIRYRTRLHGLHQGMQQQIQVTGRNVDGPCLIMAVDISPKGSALINYDVTAVEGLVIVPSHQEAWRQIEGGAVR